MITAVGITRPLGTLSLKGRGKKEAYPFTLPAVNPLMM